LIAQLLLRCKKEWGGQIKAIIELAKRFKIQTFKTFKFANKNCCAAQLVLTLHLQCWQEYLKII
jgi:hypothetical protein